MKINDKSLVVCIIVFLILITGALLSGFLEKDNLTSKSSKENITKSANETNDFKDALPGNSDNGLNDNITYIVGKGTIVYLDFEGGFFGIMSDDGERYDPFDLPKEFQIDGLKVEFELEELPGWVSYHMWGSIVKIINIENA